jgi:hypothetical protein
MPHGCVITCWALLQVWKQITERICSALSDLEAVSPPNADQLARKQLKQEQVHADLKKLDPVLPEL